MRTTATSTDGIDLTSITASKTTRTTTDTELLVAATAAMVNVIRAMDVALLTSLLPQTPTTAKATVAALGPAAHSVVAMVAF